MSLFSHRFKRQAENGTQSLKPVPAQASIRRKLFDVFSRPKSPAPSAPVIQAPVTPAPVHSGSEKQSRSLVLPKPPSSNTKTEEPSIPIQASNSNRPKPNEPSVLITEIQAEAHIESSDVSESAYHKAWCSLTEEQKLLLKGDDIGDLFDQLRDADQKHQAQSLLRRGLKVVSPYLDRLSITIDFISPFASMNPAAGTALGLIKGVNSVC
jgi:hypothetical protein